MNPPLPANERRCRFSAVVLAGGQSRRMGRDKAWIQFRGLSLLQRQAGLARSLSPERTFISGRPDTDYAALGVEVLLDRQPGCGPLGGIETALDACESPLLLVIAVDMPNLDRAWLADLLAATTDQRGRIPRHGTRIEPLAAVYPKSALATVRSLLARGELVAATFANACVEAGLADFLEVSEPDAGRFLNWNSPGDVESNEGLGSATVPVASTWRPAKSNPADVSREIGDAAGREATGVFALDERTNDLSHISRA